MSFGGLRPAGISFMSIASRPSGGSVEHEHDPEKWTPAFGEDHAPAKTPGRALMPTPVYIVPACSSARPGMAGRDWPAASMVRRLTQAKRSSSRRHRSKRGSVRYVGGGPTPSLHSRDRQFSRQTRLIATSILPRVALE